MKPCPVLSKPIALILPICFAASLLAACGGGNGNSPPKVSPVTSTITATPDTVPANGTAMAAISVNLEDGHGKPYTGDADVVISADPCTHCALDYSDHDGQITGTLSSTAAETITLSFTLNGESDPNTATVDFVVDKSRPNIVLIITDDIGIDQSGVFGYGGENPAPTPALEAIAQAGVKFGNMWSMPACSNARATVFTGRWPLRTHVMTAIGNNDLANYMVNPNEMTLPKLLKTRGYKSALFGKFHIGIQSNDPYRYGMVHALGFDYFDGWLDATGDLSEIDTTAGGVAPARTWSCGFVGDEAHGGADEGACYAADGTCQEMDKTGAEPPGRVCRDDGGIFDPNKTCRSPVPSYINFNNYSAYYVSPLVINKADGSVIRVPPTDIRARTYRATELVDAAVSWVDARPAAQPWMVTLSFATAHNPLMQPPPQLLPDGTPDRSGLDCGSLANQRTLTKAMETAADTEVGRFLVQTGLASRDADGNLIYDPAKTNTWVIYVADNGSSPLVVNPPFDASRAKSTAYQTGVWVPGIVAGPDVSEPGRQTDAMVNIADIYELAGQLAGIDVHKVVPRTVDAQSMLPYLTNPEQPEIRKTNYTQIGTNFHANGGVNGPCVYLEKTCSQIAPTKDVCHDNGGTWYGPDPDISGVPAEGLKLCCEVAVWQRTNARPVLSNILPAEAYGIRNDNYKLVINKLQAYNPAANACVAVTSTEFYQINEDYPTPKLDTAASNLLATGAPPLSTVAQQNYAALSADLDTLLASQPECPWDVNLDGVVNHADVVEWTNFKNLSNGKSSWADINQDGLTDDTDKRLIEEHFGSCPTAGASAQPSRVTASLKRSSGKK